VLQPINIIGNLKFAEIGFKEVIKLHYVKGYGADRISRILPIGHSPVSMWIAIFAAEKDKKSVEMHKSNPQRQSSVACAQEKGVASLQADVSRLQAQLKDERLRADAYDEMIRLAATVPVGRDRFEDIVARYGLKVRARAIH
jgi:hypothetical protein